MLLRNKILLSIILIIVVLASSSIITYFSLTVPRDTNNTGYYVFCYFLGNSPEEERVCFATSNNGYTFDPVGDNLPIITQKLGTGCCRDPYIFRANGKYYIIATDMKSDLGWNSNYSMVMWESTDLIKWENERIIDIKQKPGFEHTCRTWAPQVIYDKEVGKYMVYWSHCLDTDWKTYMVYAYLNDDFSDVGEIKTLYQPSSKKDAIDGDIIYENDTYYLYYKDEEKSTICYVYSDKLTGPFIEPQKNKVSTSLKEVEGCCTYKLEGTDTYIMIMDEFKDHKYYMQATTKDSMTKFKHVRRNGAISWFKPRHGSILTITEDEYTKLNQLDHQLTFVFPKLYY